MAQVVTTRDEVIKLKNAGLRPTAIGRELGISRQRAWRILNPKKEIKSRIAQYPGMLTPRDVAKFLGIHVNTVRKWSEMGVLKAYRIGPRQDRRFRKEDIEAFIVSGKRDRGKVSPPEDRIR